MVICQPGLASFGRPAAAVAGGKRPPSTLLPAMPLLRLLLLLLLLRPLLRPWLCLQLSLQLCRLLRAPLLPRRHGPLLPGLGLRLPSLHLLLCIAIAPAKGIVLLLLLLLLLGALL